MVNTGLRAPARPRDSQEEAVVACATALALQAGGLTICSAAILRLDEAMGLNWSPPSDHPLHEVFLLAVRIIYARMPSDDVAFERDRHLLRCALASYWAGRAAALGGVT
ncbi:MAG TPA: hypothetical protein DD444_16930 [Citreicella sp.]|jgi:hypothetical protein|nr:hypothetical protein [Citreicella sp.]HBT01254.1 hypothetical protein [Citreicella sp.]|tara:strand:+ start:124 stop:450 length:327 start_codon:yes stop_codon:yes gene_type:complete